MDNRLISQLKRGLKITTSYLLADIVFVIFLMPIISIFQSNNEAAIYNYSVIIFVLMFISIYVEMSRIAFKEKRPQYNINPSLFKGFLYGAIGVIPLIIVEVVIILIKVPDTFLTLQKRVYQGFAGPLYWIAKLLGNMPFHYILSFAVLILIAGLGYLAGHKNFYLTAFIREKLGIKKKVKQIKKK